MSIGTEEEYNLPEASLEEAAATIAEFREEALVHLHFVSAKISASQMEGKQCGGIGNCRFRFVGGAWVYDASIPLTPVRATPIVIEEDEEDEEEDAAPRKPGRVARWKQTVEPEDEANVLEAYSCMTMAEVHDHTGIALEALSRFLKEKGVVRAKRSQPPHPEKRARVLLLLKKQAA